MKRDARIGLAVVLVLGLAVTLLVARALYKRGGETPTEMVEATADESTAPYSGEQYRVDGANVNGTTPAAANVNAPGSAQGQEQINPAVQRFVDDQTRRMGTNDNGGLVAPVAAPPVGPAPVPAVAANGARTVNPAPLPNPAPPIGEDSALDHEAGPVTQPNAGNGEGFAYTVVSGDNPWKIAAKVYGDGKYTNKIVDANPALKSNKLKVGSTIRIPVIPQKTVLMKLPGWGDAKDGSVVAKAAPKPEAVPENTLVVASRQFPANNNAPAFGGATHKIEAGETLSAIAQKYYGSGGPKSVNRILNANKEVNASKLKVGQELVIPAIK